jgi:hypothetical protein
MAGERLRFSADVTASMRASATAAVCAACRSVALGCPVLRRAQHWQLASDVEHPESGSEPDRFDEPGVACSSVLRALLADGVAHCLR